MRLFWTVPVVALFKFGDIISDLFHQDQRTELDFPSDYLESRLWTVHWLSERRMVRVRWSLSFDVIVCESFSVIFNPINRQLNSLNCNLHFTDFYTL